MGSGVFARELHYVDRGNSREGGDRLRRILLDFLLQLVEAQRVLGDVIGVIEIFVDDDVHHRERQRDVRPRIDGQIPIGKGGGTGLIWVDDNQLRAVPTCLFYEGPQVNVGAVNVRAPGDYVLRIAEGFHIGAELASKN